MPLTEKGEKIERAMQREYGKEKGERILYASKNKGTISGIDAQRIVRDVGAMSIVNGRRTGYEISTSEDDASTAPVPPSNPVSGMSAGARERGMSTEDARRIIARIVDANPPMAHAKPARVAVPPWKDKLPTRAAFRRHVRDKVQAGVPLPKIIQSGVTWGTKPGSHSTWQPYDMRDGRSFRRHFLDAIRRGKSIRDAVDEVEAARVNMGSLGGFGVPMTGWVPTAGMGFG